MRTVGVSVLFCLLNVSAYAYDNVSDSTPLQLYKFKEDHPKPIGVLTLGSGVPVELKQTFTQNSDVLSNEFFQDAFNHLLAERVPERLVHAKGIGVHGYFVVTNDVSKYTKADVFNGIGHKTPIFTRFSTSTQNRGGTDVSREVKGMATKFYTKEGNLDILTLQVPVFFTKDPIDFIAVTRALQRNPATGVLPDNNQIWDFITLKTAVLQQFLWIMSDFGVPDGYRHMDTFAIHAFELVNKHGDRYFARFNFRTEQGLANLTTQQAAKIQGQTLDYYLIDLYSAIDQKRYPSWRLEMDVVDYKDVQELDYNPFDVTKLWEKGTYKTVPIGRLVFNKNSDNQFRDQELSGFAPSNLVPGIPGPVDDVFKARRHAYRQTQNYRIGINHQKININHPEYAKTYNRDGAPPVRDNMKDVPNYQPNSFHGPLPYVDEDLPDEKFVILDSNTVDLQRSADFYHHYVKDEGHKKRLAANIVTFLAGVQEPVLKKVLKLLKLVDYDLYDRVYRGLKAARAANEKY